MTNYDNLPLYKASYDFLLLVFLLCKNFTKEYKYTIGDDLKREILSLVKHIYRANSDQKKRIEYIEQAQIHMETIRLYVRLLKDLHQINLEKFVLLNEKFEIISKQLLAWKKYTDARL
jgi:hypothetical protein